ncbi:killer cell immunoglobulin-like receptor 2DL5A [Bubalus bubalis]|uniref:killer cell immunoglobulin-like receptor 2DL5A n=1 Tax=Bubalus bubalis TaxID=89462 RepID=UPI001E1B7FAF|nr:killer cell immunoglobulin-like receptor 2DL5A [Bubalus bubalis]
MTLASVGTYRCYGSLRRSPYEWSAPSEPVDIMITGLSKKPSLSAQGGPTVRLGENVTLVCSSESTFDQFHLLREGVNLGRPLAGGQGPHGALQAEFPLGPGTPAHSGTYRCYGSFTRSPYSWSDSSDPLFLSVTGSTTSTCPSTLDPHTTEEALLSQEHSSTWYIVLGLVIAFTSTSILLAALVCHWCSTQNHVAIMEGEPMEDRTVNDEDSAAEDVIYAHLDLRTLSERWFTPTPLRPMNPSAEPIIYDPVYSSGLQSCCLLLSRSSAMLSAIISLTCLGFFLIQSIWAQEGGHDKPSLSAWPSPVVPQGQHVTLSCHSPLGFDRFRLHKDDRTNVPELQGVIFWKNFLMGPVTEAHAGTYRCHGHYSHLPTVWSAPSDPLEIVVTGLSKKPSLSAQGGPVVRSGENVTLVCSSESAFDQFHLLREGENLGPPLAGVWVPHGALQAEFPLGPGTPAHSGVYRCYGSFTRSPYSWSDSSDPLYLSVTGNSSSSQPLHTKPNSNSGIPRHLHALVGPSVAFVFLVSLISFLVHHWCPDAKDAVIMNSQPEVGRRVNWEDPDAEELKEVTYTDLDCSVFTRKIITPTSQRPREPSANASVYMDLATC